MWKIIENNITLDELTIDSIKPALFGDSCRLITPSIVRVMPSCRTSDLLSRTKSPLTLSCNKRRHIFSESSQHLQCKYYTSWNAYAQFNNISEWIYWWGIVNINLRLETFHSRDSNGSSTKRKYNIVMIINDF